MWKSQDGTMYWLFVQNPRDKAGWYLTTTLVLDLAELAEELLLATFKIYSLDLFGRCHFHFGFICFLHETQWLFIRAIQASNQVVLVMSFVFCDEIIGYI